MSIIAEALKKAQEKRTDRPDGGETCLKGSAMLSQKGRIERKETINRKSRIFPLQNIIQVGRPISRSVLIAAVLLSAVTGIALILLRTGPRLPSELQQRPPSASPVHTEEHMYPREKSDEQADPLPSHSPSMPQEELILPTLSGIMYSPEAPRAVLNGIMASEGTIVDGFLLEKIFPGHVRITLGENEYVIELR